MVAKPDFQRKALESFRSKIVRRFGTIEDVVVVEDIPRIEVLLSELVSIGQYVILAFTAERSFDGMEAVYRKDEFLYIAWYEHGRKKGTGDSYYLKFKPRKMIVSSSQDLRRNYAVIETAQIEPIKLQSSELLVSNPDEDGVQRLVDDKGTELKELSSGELYHFYTIMCKPGRIVVHPKGSIIATEQRDYFFK